MSFRERINFSLLSTSKNAGRLQGEIEAIFRRGLLEDVHQVDLDCPWRNPEFGGNLPILQPAGDQFHDAAFARS